MREQKRGHVGGMTLVEMLVVLTLAAVTLSIGVPSMSRMIDSTRLTSSANSLFGTLMMTRSEAAKRRTRVVLCKSDNGSGCTKEGAWEQGWIVFQDSNNNAAVDAGEAIISREQSLGSNLRVTGNLPVADYVSYAPDGRTQYTSGAFQAGAFTICMRSATATEARTIVISASGRPRTTKTASASCA